MHVLGVGLFQEGTPKLIGHRRFRVDQSAIDGRQPVVHGHVDPLASHPESVVFGSYLQFTFLFLYLA
jgi:hypothetical protein